MRTFEQKQIERSILVDVTCDRCGASCVKDRFVPLETYRGYLGPEIAVLLIESGQFAASWGYHSNHDDERWQAELCETCCDELKVWIEAKGGKMGINDPRGGIRS